MAKLLEKELTELGFKLTYRTSGGSGNLSTPVDRYEKDHIKIEVTDYYRLMVMVYKRKELVADLSYNSMGNTDGVVKIAIQEIKDIANIQ